MRWKWKVGFLLAVVLFVVLAAFFSKRREAVALPLAFAGFTNVAGEASALFRFEIPPPPGFLRLQSWEMPKAHIACKLADGRHVTNSVQIKWADFQTFATGTNAVIQIRIGLPTNAMEFSVDYAVRLKEGFSAGALDFYLPMEKALVYRSGDVAVERDPGEYLGPRYGGKVVIVGRRYRISRLVSPSRWRP